MSVEDKYIINERSYGVYVRSLQVLENRLGLNIKIHNKGDLLNKGQIFLFNHFTRFETIIPPYLIYRATGAYSRSVADHKLFDINDNFAGFLRNGGAVPDNLPGLLPFLAAEVLRGRKIVIFPEGGMIKDRRVLDRDGRFRIFSPSSLEYRKHHQGAAVLALTLDLFKRRIKDLFNNNDTRRIEHWCEALGLANKEELLVQAEMPTLIVPATISFFPMRIGGNFLSKGFEFFAKNVSDRIVEELAVEGNLLFHDTDMDIRLGRAINTQQIHQWRPWHDLILKRFFLKITSLNDFFGLKTKAGNWEEHFLARFIIKGSKRIRDVYMERLYSGVTINMSHLASVLIMTLVAGKRMEVSADEFHKALYITIKRLQNEPDVYLHRGLVIPDCYRTVLDGKNVELRDFLKTCEGAKLIDAKSETYRFFEKLQAEQGLNEVRRENPVQVSANEIAPISQVQKAIDEALQKLKKPDEHEFAKYLFDDEIRSFSWNQKKFEKKQFQEINKKETATYSGEPFFLFPKRPSKAGVLLVHGFSSSPAEMFGLGEEMQRKGHVVLGVRLAGHGTSPWDMQERRWSEWLDSVRRGYHILSTITDHIVIVGFSAGGALAMLLAAEKPKKLRGVASVSAPLSVQDENFNYVPVVHFLNKLVRFIPGVDGIQPFYENNSNHPEINYRSVPLRALNEFRALMKTLKSKLPEVRSPALVIQSHNDQVVDPESAKIILNIINSKDKTLHLIESNRHGLIYENIGETWTFLERFIRDVIPDVGEHYPKTNIASGKDYPAGLDRNLKAIEKPVCSLFDDAAESTPERPCINFLGKTYTYREIHNLIRRTAAGFQHLDIKKGDRIGICLPNSPYFVIAYYAALKVGAIVVNFNPLYTQEEIATQIEDSEVSIMLTLDLDLLYSKVAATLKSTTLKRIIVCPFTKVLPPFKRLLFTLLKNSQIAKVPQNDRNISFDLLTSHGDSPVPVAIEPSTDIALLQYTGGTTGLPKGAMLTHTNVSTNTEQVRLWLGDVNPGGERFLAVLPFFHVFAMTTIMNLGIATSSELILLPRFEIKGLLKTIVKTRPTIFPGVPTIFSAINHFPKIERFDLSSIRYCISGGASLPKEVKSRFESLTGCVLVEGYGLSETSPVLTCNPLQSGGKENSIGLALPGTEIKIIDLKNPDKSLKPGEQGEVCVRGPQVMAGYWKRSQESKDVFIKGWLRTGDGGYIDDDGYVFLVDRLKEIIISSGYNIYPRMIESALYRHPDVLEAVVIGIPDEYRGEEPKAFVKLKTGAAITEEELKKFANGHLNPIEHLAEVEFRTELPKTLIGKLSKKELVQEEAEKRRKSTG